MDRQYFADIAHNGLRMPIGTDLVLHEHADHDLIRLDGDRMARVIVDAAKRYRTPLAVPQMDLTREKSVLLELMDIDSDGEYHFTAPPTEQQVEQLHKRLRGELPRVVTAHIEAIRKVSGVRDLVSVGMVIGRFH